MTKKLSFAQILLIASILGIAAGFIGGNRVMIIKPLGDLFVRLLFMIVPGLVFFSIASSFANISDVRKLKKWAGKVVGWFVLTTLIGTFIGILAGFIWKPGTGLVIEGQKIEQINKLTVNTFLDWIPSNALGAITEGNVIQIVIFAVISGLIIVLLENGKDKTVLKDILNAGMTLFVTIAKYIMYYAPIGVFALMAVSISTFKSTLVSEMFRFITAYTIGFVIHITLMYFIVFWLITRLNVFTFTKKIFPALITAFTTCSSAATLPVTLRCMKEVGVSDELSNFGIPLGVTFNMDSMAIEIPLYIMLGMYAVGTNPTIIDLLQFVFLGVLFSIGCAGVPGGGLAIATILIQAFNLPTQIVAWIAAIFAYLDVTGTAINVWGDMVCTTIVAKSEDLLDMNHL
ncbi:dicarboxylate/amino acid:cation symporter [Biomaibacter acetigenes]|uniref:Dicarboxylate/amino acid:cation symporter n=1 Tax=Biomaibacter acetigenes TaxID=2316383 RepID=A0A3G2R7L1_9FIRM|nr:dicarboxylate/amino acid:cation symporter [Biomaibacter acetigenes]AYO31393.1 dicarboxylate/amino acid:cation symporter [Biomaibacter acetigenes]